MKKNQKTTIKDALNAVIYLVMASLFLGVGFFFLICMTSSIVGTLITHENMVKQAVDIVFNGHVFLVFSLIFALSFFFILKGVIYIKRRMMYETELMHSKQTINDNDVSDNQKYLAG